jgi:hypothetical protein
MVIEEKNLRKVQTWLLMILAALWILFCYEAVGMGDVGPFNGLSILVLTLLAAGFVLILLLRRWEGVVESRSEVIERLSDPDEGSERVELHFATIRLASGRRKKLRLGSDAETLARLDIREGDLIVKRRWALFCVVEKKE